jgi:enoyl-CoA hydratase/carnithine racemase
MNALRMVSLWHPRSRSGNLDDAIQGEHAVKHGRILLDMADGVAVMTLNDPGVLNAFGQKLREDMSDALDRLEASEARCLLITGAGRAFCSGANLADPDRPPRDREAEATKARARAEKRFGRAA